MSSKLHSVPYSGLDYCVTDPMIYSVTFPVASQFVFELVLEDVGQKRRNGIVAVCSLLRPGSLTCCCLECVGNFQMVSKMI